MRKKYWSILGLALGVLVLGALVGLLTVNTVAADPTPGVKIQVPRVDVGEGITLGDGPWETWIQVQNVSPPDPVTGIEPDTGAIFLGWGEYSGLCPTNDPGVVAHYCQLIKGNALWTLRTQLVDEVRSGIIYSVRADLFTAACSAAELTEHDTDAWRCWKEEWEYGTCEGTAGGWADPPGAVGEELAVTVNRYGPNDYGTFVSSTYTGISEEMEGEDPPYEYYAPYIMKSYLNQLDTELTIQNSGQDCTSVWIDYMEQGTCYVVYKQHIEQLAPGEAVRVRVPTVPGVLECAWPGWLGSAHIAAEQPLGIIVDQTSFEDPCASLDRGTLLTHRARPKIEVRDGELIEDTLVYADLIFREWSGWDASIQVQNLSSTGQRTFVTVDFMDNSGDEILFLADWVCPTGSTTFYLPPVTNLGFDYIGAAEIQSHDQVGYPGEVTEAQPIFAVVDLKKADDPFTPQMDAQGGSYNAHPYSQKEWVTQIALPFMGKEANDMYTSWTSMIAIRNNSNCNKFKSKIWFKDETGTLLCELRVPWLHPKHVNLIDLNNVGCLYPGYVGAAKVIIDPETDVEQLCDVDNNGHADNEPFMPSVIVIEKGIGYGDITKIYEGIPYAFGTKICYGDIFGAVALYDYELNEIDPEANEPLPGAMMTADTGQTDTTSWAGGYELVRVPSGLRTVTAEKFGYYPWTEEVDLDCGADTKQDLLLVCQGILYGTVEDSATNTAIEGAVVTLDVESVTLGRTWHITDTTDVNGLWWMIVPLVGNAGDADAPWTLTISMAGYDDWIDAGTAFADDIAAGADPFESAHCVGVGSAGCDSGEAFCDPPNDVFEDHEYFRSVSQLIHHAFIQGRVYCDGLVNNNGVFDPGEEQPNTTVKLYQDLAPLGDGDIFLPPSQLSSDPGGFYQFEVSLDTDGDGTIDRDDYTVTAGTQEVAFTDMLAHETRVINIDICP